jgi:hypothetical protein
LDRRLPGHRADDDGGEETAMTDPDREHTTEPAEGAENPGADESGRTPHPEQPAEGPADDPDVDPVPPETPGEL